MTWMVTGGCGFLGSNIAAAVLARGERVIIVDSLIRNGAERNLAWLRSQVRRPVDLVHHRIDVSDRAAVAAIISQTDDLDAVAHVAGQVAMTKSLQDPWFDFTTNAQGTLSVLEGVRAHAPHATMLFSSTNKVYGDLLQLRYGEQETRYTLLDHPQGLDESLPLDFSSPYGCSKGAADQYVRDWHRCYGLSTVVFRHSSIYGGRQFATADQGWVGWFVGQVLRQRVERETGRAPSPFTVSGDGKQVRDVLHAEDLVRLYLTAHERIDRVAGEVFNIGGGNDNSLSILELVAALGDMMGTSPIFERIAWRQADQRVFIADISKAAALLGWQPQVPWRSGLRQMAEWVAAEMRSLFT